VTTRGKLGSRVLDGLSGGEKEEKRLSGKISEICKQVLREVQRKDERKDRERLRIFKKLEFCLKTICKYIGLLVLILIQIRKGEEGI
jgi:hypothetical protein